MAMTKFNFVATAMICMLVAGCGGSNDDRPSRLSGSAGGDRPVHQLKMGVPNASLLDNPGLSVFVRSVQRRSGGRLRIVPQGVGYERENELPGAIRAGRYDLTWIKARRVSGIDALDVLEAPLVIDSYHLQRELFARGFGRRLLRTFEGTPLRGIALLPDWLARPVSIGSGLTRPEDWQRIRGFASVPGLWREALNALQAGPGVVDDIGNPSRLFASGKVTAGALPIPGLVPNNVGAFGVTVTANLAFGTRVLVILGHERRLARLIPKEQEWLAAAGRDASRASLAVGEDDENDLLADACRSSGIRAVVASEANLRELRRRVARVYRAVGDRGFQEALAFVESVRRDIRPQAARVPKECRGPLPPQALPVRHSTAPDALDGDYRLRTREQDYTRGGLEKALARDAAGTHTVRIRRCRGTVRRRSQSQSVGVPPRVEHFRCNVQGDRATFFFEASLVTVRWRRVSDGSLRFDSDFRLDPLWAPAFARTWQRLR